MNRTTVVNTDPAVTVNWFIQFFEDSITIKLLNILFQDPLLGNKSNEASHDPKLFVEALNTSRASSRYLQLEICINCFFEFFELVCPAWVLFQMLVKKVLVTLIFLISLVLTFTKVPFWGNSYTLSILPSFLYSGSLYSVSLATDLILMFLFLE